MNTAPTNLEPTGGEKQEWNPVRTGGVDIQNIEFLLKICKNWPESRFLSGAMLVCLCQLSIAHPEKARSGFDAWDIYNEMPNAYHKPKWAYSDKDDPEAIAKRVRVDLWDKLVELWPKKVEGVTQQMTDAGFSDYLIPFRIQGGGSGNPTRYLLKTETANIDKPLPASTATKDISTPPLTAPIQPSQPVTTIRYHVEDVLDSNWIVRWLGTESPSNRLRRKTFIWTIAISWLLLTAFAIFCIFLFYYGNLTLWEGIKTAASCAVILGFGWMALYPIISLNEKRIALAPGWMQTEQGDLLLQWQIGANENASIKTVRYTGQCPICGGNTRIQSSRLIFKGRIIGRCENNPSEHHFSFDFITRNGKLLL